MNCLRLSNLIKDLYNVKKIKGCFVIRSSNLIKDLYNVKKIKGCFVMTEENIKYQVTYSLITLG